MVKKIKVILSVISIIVFLFPILILAEGNILIEKEYTVGPNDNLSVKVSVADIQLKSWDKEEVNIKIIGSESVNDYFKFDFSYVDGSVNLVSEKKEDWGSWGYIKNYSIKIYVPSKFNIDVKTSGGDIEAKMIKGNIQFYTSGGDLELKSLKGELVVKTSGGDIELKDFEGNSEVKTSGGDIEAKGIDGSIVAKTSGGDIEINAKDGKVIAGTSGGDIGLKFSGNNLGVELYTSGGSINVQLSEDFSADVLLKTSGGSIKNKFNNSRASVITKNKFEGKFNNGGAEFTAKTSGGSIYINDK